MPPLGKPLVFYLKYMAEMQGLYEPEGGEPDLTGLRDAEHVREMVRTVGAAASEQVAVFLELCGKRIDDHFTSLGIANLAKKTSRARVVHNWERGVEVHVSSVPGGCFSCGLFVSAPPYVRTSIENGVSGVTVPWLWSRGGRKGEDAVWKILGGWPHSRAGEGLVDTRGAVALACIPIKAQPAESYDVDRDPLIAEVTKTITRIGAKETKAIATFVAGLKEPEEA